MESMTNFFKQSRALDQLQSQFLRLCSGFGLVRANGAPLASRKAMLSSRKRVLGNS